MAHSGRPFWYDKAFYLSRLHENLYMDLAGVPPQHLMTYFPKLETNADRILFGTDFPAQPKPLRTLIETIERLPLRPESIEKILGENAKTSAGFVRVSRSRVRVRSGMLNRIVQEACRTGGSRTALVFGNERWTYAQLEEQVARCAAGLKKSGAERRTRRSPGPEDQPGVHLHLSGGLPAWGSGVPGGLWFQGQRTARVLTENQIAVVVCEPEQMSSIEQIREETGQRFSIYSRGGNFEDLMGHATEPPSSRGL